MSWRVDGDCRGLRIVDEDGEDVELPGVARVDCLPGRRVRDPMRLVLYPIPGRESHAHVARRTLSLELTESWLTVEVAEPERVTFIGGPLHGQVRRLPTAAGRPMNHYTYAEPVADFDPITDDAEPERLAPSPSFRRHEYELMQQGVEGVGTRWAYVHHRLIHHRLIRRRVPRPSAIEFVPVERPPAFNPLGWRECRACEVRWTGGVHCWSCGEPGEESYAPHVGEVGYA